MYTVSVYGGTSVPAQMGVYVTSVYVHLRKKLGDVLLPFVQTSPIFDDDTTGPGGGAGGATPSFLTKNKRDCSLCLRSSETGISDASVSS